MGSARAGGSGNTDACVASWTSKCGVDTYDDTTISRAAGNRGGLGLRPERGTSEDENNPNPGYTDNAVAADSGDIYFYSPEQLETGKGIPTRENLYVFREGSVRHVATLNDDPYCLPKSNVFVAPLCSDGAAGRLQVTDDGRYAAFITTTQLTPYDNMGYGEMYRYDAVNREIACMSCDPKGAPPTEDVWGSQGGRFITNDGRVFFETVDPLDPRDTNGVGDVYEFVDGKPQLITTGTGTATGAEGEFSAESISGLYGVSADGVDVYFGTFDTLVGQDRNGQSLKFYDARTGGGFPYVPPPLPCEAADECHGTTSEAAQALRKGTVSDLGKTGNVQAKKKTKKKKSRKHRKVRKHHGRKKEAPWKEGNEEVAQREGDPPYREGPVKMSARPKIVMMIVSAVGLFGLSATAASASVPVLAYDIIPSSTQAGGHPDLQISFSLQTGRKQQVETGLSMECDCQNPRFVTINTPAGVIGNPHAAPRCRAVDFANEHCPVDSQIGFIQVGLSLTSAGDLPVVAGVLQPHPPRRRSRPTRFSRF